MTNIPEQKFSSETSISDAIDPKQFWSALGSRACGGAIVTAAGLNGPAGFLALSVTHLTQTPPTIIVTIGTTTSALTSVIEARHFAVNYLAKEQADLAEVFGGKTDKKGADRFESNRWTTMKTGAPILRDAVGTLDCRLVETIERFGTVIAIGAIVGFSANSDASPLIFFRGKTS